MTQQIGRAYRKNRRMSILLFAVVILIAAMAIPLASGGSDKYYTLGYDAANTGALTICAGDTVDVTLKLSNKARSQTLGSADVTFPSSVVTALGTPTSSKGTVSLSGNKVSLRNLSLPAKTGFVTFTVGVRADTVGAAKKITAVVKQSNNFNDSGGDANLFKLQGSLPTLTVVNCVGTIEGTVWNDKNESGDRPAADAPFEPLQGGWQIAAYRVGATTPASTTTTLADGTYKLENVPLNKAYVVCEKQPAGDTLHTWGQTTPTAESTPCMTYGYQPNGIELPTFTASVTGKDFGNIETASLGCDEGKSTNPEFAVQSGAGDNCKTGTTSTDYVYEKWAEGTKQYAAFHPVAGNGLCDLGSTSSGTCTYFVQRVTWTFDTNQQPDPAGRSLKYDDVKDSSDGSGYEYEAMKFCKKDPRNGTEFGLPPLGSPSVVKTDVLPDGTRVIDDDPQTTCLITSTETAKPGGKIERTDYVFTAVDGRFASP